MSVGVVINFNCRASQELAYTSGLKYIDKEHKGHHRCGTGENSMPRNKELQRLTWSDGEREGNLNFIGSRCNYVLIDEIADLRLRSSIHDSVYQHHVTDRVIYIVSVSKLEAI